MNIDPREIRGDLDIAAEQQQKPFPAEFAPCPTDLHDHILARAWLQRERPLCSCDRTGIVRRQQRDGPFRIYDG